MTTAGQAVKEKCSVSFVLEGRKVDDATMVQASPGGLSGRSGASGLVGPLHLHDWVYSHATDRSEALDCERPAVFKCRVCPEIYEGRCKATRDDRCIGCAKRHGWDVARKIRSGFTAERLEAALIVVLTGTREERRGWLKSGMYGSHGSDRPSGFFFVTLTAPGAAGGLRFDRELCGHAPGQCSNKGHGRGAGEVVCKVERMPAAVWNGQAPRRWNDWVTDVRRRLCPSMQFCGAWETQVRGMLHRHVLVYAPGVTAQRFYSESKEVAIRLGFGRQFEADPMSGADAKEIAMAAGYIASYVTKCGDELATCVNPRSGEMEQGSYRRHSSSRQWGVTMAQIRQERRQWAMERYGASAGGAAPAVPGAAPGGAAALDSEQEIYASCALLRRVLGAQLV